MEGSCAWLPQNTTEQDATIQRLPGPMGSDLDHLLQGRRAAAGLHEQPGRHEAVVVIFGRDLEDHVLTGRDPVPDLGVKARFRSTRVVGR